VFIFTQICSVTADVFFLRQLCVVCWCLYGSINVAVLIFDLERYINFWIASYIAFTFSLSFTQISMDVQNNIVWVTSMAHASLWFDAHYRTLHTSVHRNVTKYFTSSLLLIQLNAQPECSRKMLKLALKFKLKCSYMFRLHNHHQGAYCCALVKL